MKSCIYSNNDNNLIYSLLNHINTINDNTIKIQYINALQSYKQSDRLILYKFAWFYLFKKGYIYPSHHSRKDVETALSAPHDDNFNKIKAVGVDNDVIFPKSLRPDYVNNIYAPNNNQHFPDDIKLLLEPSKVNWRYRVPDQKSITFYDERCGNQEYTSDIDFGDFLIWRLDGYPSYELAVVVDDILMNITEIVRGEDLLLSTARQILLYNAFGIPAPDFYHCPLVTDPNTGKRLAKSEKALSLRELRAANVILNVDTILLIDKKEEELAARKQILEKVEKESKRIELQSREAQLEASQNNICTSTNCQNALATVICCPCICFSFTCLAVAVDRDNDEYYCACCGWDFLECRQESSNACLECCEGSCIPDCLAYWSKCCRMSPGDN